MSPFAGARSCVCYAVAGPTDDIAHGLDGGFYGGADGFDEDVVAGAGGDGFWEGFLGDVDRAFFNAAEDCADGLTADVQDLARAGAHEVEGLADGLWDMHLAPGSDF